MAKLINGNGNLAIYAEEDADWYASIFGNQTSITGIGNQFAYSLLDANTIGVEDGVIITKEGRRIQLNANEIDEFEIPNGSQGTTNYYIIGYRLITDETSAQTCETFVELMDNGTDTIPEGSFREGDDSVDVSLYRVKQEDLTITAVTLLLPKVGAMSAMANDIATLNTNLTEISEKVGGGMKCAMFGTINASGDNNIDISSLNLQSEEDYLVILDSDTYAISSTHTNGDSNGDGAYLKAKTATNFTITARAIPVSYQVITFR